MRKYLQSPVTSEKKPLALIYENSCLNSLFILLIMLPLFVCCADRSKASPQSSTRSDLRNLLVASKFDDLFEIVSCIQLDTLPECPISSITDMDIDGQGNFIIADGWNNGQVYSFASDAHFLRIVEGVVKDPASMRHLLALPLIPTERSSFVIIFRINSSSMVRIIDMKSPLRKPRF